MSDLFTVVGAVVCAALVLRLWLVLVLLLREAIVATIWFARVWLYRGEARVPWWNLRSHLGMIWWLMRYSEPVLYCQPGFVSIPRNPFKPIGWEPDCDED